MHAGLPRGQLVACFVLPVEDSLERMFTAVRDATPIHHWGGGVGDDFPPAAAA
jgi:ribonucleoside-diphosphate reductase alpha chain